jgi:uncharacterized protein (TIGR02328 family)
MRLWHQSLIPYLDRQRLLSQHREVCALRGKGWGRKHATVDYVFKHGREVLFAYHMAVIREMENRGYKANKNWLNSNYPRYTTSAITIDPAWCMERYNDICWYPEHDRSYLIECINLLKQRNAPMDFEKIERELL